MDDLISRQAAINAVKSRKTAEQSSAGIMRNAVVDFCVDIIKKLPSAQPERKKGKWLVDEDGNMECPFCGNTCGFGNYCNECGADLRGEQDE